MTLLQIKNLGISLLHWSLRKQRSLLMRVTLVDLLIEPFSISVLRCSFDLEFPKMDELLFQVPVSSVPGMQVLLRGRYFLSYGLKDFPAGMQMALDQDYLIEEYHET